MAVAWGRPSAKNATTGIPIVVDTDALAAIGRGLRASGREGRAGFRKAMRAGGELVAADARERADFSTRIPGSIVVRTTGSNFKVRAGGSAAPNAAAIENRGKGFVRHPVFGRRDNPNDWTEKNSHPAVLAPALQAQADNVIAAVVSELDVALARALGA